MNKFYSIFNLYKNITYALTISPANPTRGAKSSTAVVAAFVPMPIRAIENFHCPTESYHLFRLMARILLLL